MTTKEAYIQHHLNLLDLEYQEEYKRNGEELSRCSPKELEKRGLGLRRLFIKRTTHGLYGKFLVKLVRAEQSATASKSNDKNSRPSRNVFSNGDIAQLTLLPADSDSTSNSAASLNRDRSNPSASASGIVYKVTARGITVAFDEAPEFLLDASAGAGCAEAEFTLVRMPSEVTYRRMKDALRDVLSPPASLPHLARLVGVLFVEEQLAIVPPPEQPTAENAVSFFNRDLNDSQREAVEFALRQSHIAIIHGPPGTGKTTTVVELIRQLVQKNQKVLVCAPSNIAVDNLVERLAPAEPGAKGGAAAGVGRGLVRLGHPARLLPSVLRHSLDAVLAACEETQIANAVRGDIDRAYGRLRCTRAANERREARAQIEQLRDELWTRERRLLRQVLRERVSVVCATLTTAGLDGTLQVLHQTSDSSTESRAPFDCVVIDECTQSVEAACWIALRWAPKCILAGDHLQLPPTLLSKEAEEGGLGVSLQERIVWTYPQTVKLLNTQYRMHEKIMRFSSEQLYGSQLFAHESVRRHLLRDLPLKSSSEEADLPLVFVNTDGFELHELNTPGEESKANVGEAELVCAHLNRLVSAGLRPADIAIIAPYNLQVHLLRSALLPTFGPELEIMSVDGFQGREKEAVIVCLVRSNGAGELGFLWERRRLNVALTRARRHLCLVADAGTIERAFEGLSCSRQLRATSTQQQQVGTDSSSAALPLQPEAQPEAPPVTVPESNSDVVNLHSSTPAVCSKVASAGDVPEAHASADETSSEERAEGTDAASAIETADGVLLSAAAAAGYSHEKAHREGVEFLHALIEYCMSEAELRTPDHYSGDLQRLSEQLSPALDAFRARYSMRSDKPKPKPKQTAAKTSAGANGATGAGATSKSRQNRRANQANAASLAQSARRPSPSSSSGGVQPPDLPNDRENMESLRENHLRQVITGFVRDPSLLHYEFASSLTPHDRYLVHKICEELQLTHISVGEGDDRHVRVCRPVDRSSSRSSAQSGLVAFASLRARIPESAAEAESATPPISSAGEIEANLPPASQSHLAAQADSVSSASSPKAGKKNKKNPSSPAVSVSAASAAASSSGSGAASSGSRSLLVDPVAELETASAQDEEALLEKARALNKQCGFRGCRNSTALFGELCACQDCRLRFCLSHAQPEVHGCGDAARRAAREQLRTEFERAGGQRVPDSATRRERPTGVGLGALYGSGLEGREARHEALRKRLDRKLNKMAEQRKPASESVNNKKN